MDMRISARIALLSIGGCDRMFEDAGIWVTGARTVVKLDEVADLPLTAVPEKGLHPQLGQHCARFGAVLLRQE